MKKQVYQILSLENSLAKAAGSQTPIPYNRIKSNGEPCIDTISDRACRTCTDVLWRDINSKLEKSMIIKYNPMNMNDIKKCKANLTADLTPIHIFFTNVKESYKYKNHIYEIHK